MCLSFIWFFKVFHAGPKLSRQLVIFWCYSSQQIAVTECGMESRHWPMGIMGIFLTTPDDATASWHWIFHLDPLPYFWIVVSSLVALKKGRNYCNFVKRLHWHFWNSIITFVHIIYWSLTKYLNNCTQCYCAHICTNGEEKWQRGQWMVNIRPINFLFKKI